MFKEDKKRLLKKSLALTLAASVGIAILFLVIPNIFIYIFYGSKFLGAVRVLQWWDGLIRGRGEWKNYK